MTRHSWGLLFVATIAVVAPHALHADSIPTPYGLPPVPVPEDNPQTAAKVALGDMLFHDMRFSPTGEAWAVGEHGRIGKRSF